MIPRLKSERSKKSSLGKSWKMKPRLNKRKKNRESVVNETSFREALVVGCGVTVIDQMMENGHQEKGGIAPIIGAVVTARGLVTKVLQARKVRALHVTARGELGKRKRRLLKRRLKQHLRQP